MSMLVSIPLDYAISFDEYRKMLFRHGELPISSARSTLQYANVFLRISDRAVSAMQERRFDEAMIMYARMLHLFEKTLKGKQKEFEHGTDGLAYADIRKSVKDALTNVEQLISGPLVDLHKQLMEELTQQRDARAKVIAMQHEEDDSQHYLPIASPSLGTETTPTGGENDELDQEAQEHERRRQQLLEMEAARDRNNKGKALPNQDSGLEQKDVYSLKQKNVLGQEEARLAAMREALAAAVGPITPEGPPTHPASTQRASELLQDLPPYRPIDLHPSVLPEPTTRPRDAPESQGPQLATQQPLSQTVQEPPRTQPLQPQQPQMLQSPQMMPQMQQPAPQMMQQPQMMQLPPQQMMQQPAQGMRQPPRMMQQPPPQMMQPQMMQQPAPQMMQQPPHMMQQPPQQPRQMHPLQMQPAQIAQQQPQMTRPAQMVQPQPQARQPMRRELTPPASPQPAREDPLPSNDLLLRVRQPSAEEVRRRTSCWRFDNTIAPNSRQDCRRGLVNLGNTCYINSTLQALHSTALGTYFHDDDYIDSIVDRYTGGGKVANTFTFVMREMETRVPHPISASHLKKCIGSVNESFAGGSQQDANEFLRTLLDCLHEDLNAHQKEKVTFADIDNTTGTDEDIAEKYWRQYQAKNDSVVVKWMAFQERSVILCPNCSTSHRSFSPTMSVELPIPTLNRAISIEDCLAAYAKSEVLDADSLYNCDKCNTKVRATKQMCFFSLPQILVITLKRFRAYGNFSDKLLTPVAFQSMLDMRPFLAPSIQSTVGNTTYQLVAIVNHQGNMHGGHYTADTRGKGDGLWFHFSDEDVKPAVEPNFTLAYILFYARALRNRPQ